MIRIQLRIEYFIHVRVIFILPVRFPFVSDRFRFFLCLLVARLFVKILFASLLVLSVFLYNLSLLRVVLQCWPQCGAVRPKRHFFVTKTLCDVK